MTPGASVLVLGTGSIGARHARNLRAAGAEVTVSDPDEARARAVADELSVRHAPFDLDGLAGYAGVVVASPTTHHADQTAAATQAGAKVLVEKPLATTAADAATFGAASDRVMVGYNLRFHEPLRVLRRLTAEGRAGRVLGARFWFGSHLPDWRPGIDYRASYSARRDLGGGVLLDAIHELDLVVWWFGADVVVAGAVVATVGSLGLEVEDTVKALLVAPDGAVIDVSLDYLSRGYRRGVEVVGEEATLRYDWQRKAIEIDTPERTEVQPIDVPVARSYELEDDRFLGWIAGRAAPEVDGEAGLASLRLADDIRRLG